MSDQSEVHKMFARAGIKFYTNSCYNPETDVPRRMQVKSKLECTPNQGIIVEFEFVDEELKTIRAILTSPCLNKAQ